ncbi:hypothetical protein ACFQFH_16725 [Halobaculum halobium]
MAVPTVLEFGREVPRASERAQPSGEVRAPDRRVDHVVDVVARASEAREDGLCVAVALGDVQ